MTGKPVELEAVPELLDSSSKTKYIVTRRWSIINVALLKTEQEKKIGHRLNALGSFYYFCKVVLRKHRFTDSLHKAFCDLVESYHLKESIEIPRDHFKSTIFSECAPMWWALSFTDEDEMWMRKLGYDDAWIHWMHRAHNQNTRTLLVSENITNAKKLGRRISIHYQDNDLFRYLFPELIPNERCKWTEDSLQHPRTRDVSPQGEGTYDFLGVGGALQSRHYDRAVQDDLVGRKALGSQVVMQTTIEYHQLLVGAFDSSQINKTEDNDEIVVGNRWSDQDLSQWLRENEPYFRFHTHSALGGCCPLHPPNVPIFPEEYSIEKLMRWKMRLGSYLFSCQFLNNPLASGTTRWKEEHLRYFNYEMVNPEVCGLDAEGKLKFVDHRLKICHEATKGVVQKDFLPLEFAKISLISDPAHSNTVEAGKDRCRHAILVVGYLKKPQRVYILDSWAKACTYNEYMNQLLIFVKRWKLREIWLETIAMQEFIKFHLEYKMLLGEIPKFRINPLKVDKSPQAKARRIESFDSFYENGQVYCRRKDSDFIYEYLNYPRGKTVDLLDTLGHSPQTWNAATSVDEIEAFMRKQKMHHNNSRRAGNVTGY